mmetsp:Transcript_14674/g.34847  ORF Transcript_14674/g.34847 Transcript_14674/m.34847 type:complete len:141 (-) Transcript_14674:210-632(-)
MRSRQCIFWFCARVVQEVADFTQYGSEDMFEEFPFFIALLRLPPGTPVLIQENGTGFNSECQVPDKKYIWLRMLAAWVANCLVRQYLHYLIPLILMNAETCLGFLQNAFALAYVVSLDDLSGDKTCMLDEVTWTELDGRC